MAIASSVSNGLATISLEETFTHVNIREFRHHYEQYPQGTRFEIDFSRTNYLDSSGLGMLLVLAEYAGDKARTIRLVNCCRTVYEVLQVAKLDELFVVQAGSEV